MSKQTQQHLRILQELQEKHRACMKLSHETAIADGHFKIVDALERAIEDINRLERIG